MASASRSPSTSPAWAPLLGLALVAAPVVVVVTRAWAASVDVPYIDDYDALLGFLRMADQTPSLGGKLRLLVEPHNEHGMALPRLAALATRGITGRLDFLTLNLLGTGQLLLLLGALFLAFRRGEAAADRLLPFAPAALLLVHHQYWMIYHSPTTSLSSVAVVVCAALAFVALQRGGAAGLAAAAGLALLASETLANGFLIHPLGVLVPALERRYRYALAWALLGAAGLAFHFAVVAPAAPGADLFGSLRDPARLVEYTLNLVGCAAGFSQRGFSLAMGALLLAVFAAAALRGLPRRSPVLFALLLFLLASVAANALARSQAGAALPLLQPRYRFYGALLLAMAYLSWAELRPDARRAFAAALVGSIAFSLASFHVYRDRLDGLSQRLAEGYERWWLEGNGGLQYPDFRTADTHLLGGLDAGWLRPPPAWLDRHAAWPIPRDPPPADGAVEVRLDLVSQDERALFLSGWARAGSAEGQAVEIVLRSPQRALVFPARSVPRVDLPAGRPELARHLLMSGFRVIVPKQALPAGRYRVGVLVRRGGREHLTMLRRQVEVSSSSRH